jgi:hypothetical protein
MMVRRIAALALLALAAACTTRNPTASEPRGAAHEALPSGGMGSGH